MLVKHITDVTEQARGDLPHRLTDNTNQR